MSDEKGFFRHESQSFEYGDIRITRMLTTSADQVSILCDIEGVGQLRLDEARADTLVRLLREALHHSLPMETLR